MSSLRARAIRRISSRYVKGIDAEHADVPAIRRRLDRISQVLKRAFRRVGRSDRVNGLVAEWLRPERRSAATKCCCICTAVPTWSAAADASPDGQSYCARGRHQCAAAGISPRARTSVSGGYRGCRRCLPCPACRRLQARQYLHRRRFRGWRADRRDAAVVARCRRTDARRGRVAFAVSRRHRQRRVCDDRAATQDPWFDASDLPVVVRHYCGSVTDPKNPLVSPVFANVAGLPPMYIQVGDDEILLSDSTRFAEKIRSRGPRCRARDLAGDVACVSAVYRQDAGESPRDQKDWRLPTAHACGDVQPQKPDCLCELVKHLCQERADGRLRLLPCSSVSASRARPPYP